MMDAVAPGLLLAQGIGRWGNYWNQELYGRPTSLPWGLKIDPAHRMNGCSRFATFQPAFLYEFVWDVVGAGLLLWIDRRSTRRRPALFALYVASYTTFRTFEEVLRIDPSNHFLHIRITFRISLGVWLLSVGLFVCWQFRRQPADKPVPKPRPVPTGPRMAVPKG